jgi:hypothetical protein
MALTTTATLTQEFVEALAMEMLPKPDDKYPFFDAGMLHQPYSPGSLSGANVIDIQQPVLPGGTMTEAARRLTEGTALATTGLAITETRFQITVREYGGPHDGTNVQPFGITEFLLKRAAHDLLADLGGKLRRDYLRWRDAVVREMALATTNAVMSSPSLAEGAITANIAASYAMLVRVRRALANALIPPLANGRYIGFVSTKDYADLLADADIKQAMATRDDAPVITGYIGTVCGIDLYEATYFLTKGVGAGQAVTGYQSLFFGGIPFIGYYSGMPVTPRVSTDNDFGRKQLLAWVAHEAYGPLDINNACVRGIST